MVFRPYPRRLEYLTTFRCQQRQHILLSRGAPPPGLGTQHLPVSRRAHLVIEQV